MNMRHIDGTMTEGPRSTARRIGQRAPGRPRGRCERVALFQAERFSRWRHERGAYEDPDNVPLGPRERPHPRSEWTRPGIVIAGAEWTFHPEVGGPPGEEPKR